MNDDSRPEAGRFIRPVDLDNEQRSTLGAKIGWSLEAFAWDWVYWNPMAALSLEAASNTVSRILKTIGPATSQHRSMIRNLRMAFPDWSEKQVEECAKGAWENLGRLAGEMPHLAKMKPYVRDSRIEVVGAERLDTIRASKKPVVFVTGHFANWEVMASAICNRPLDCQITYRAANNPYIDRRIAKARHAYGIQVLTPKGAGTRELMRALGRGQSIALLNDQKFNQGLAVPFFGHDAMTAPGPTRLAMKFKAPLLPISCKRLGPARYRVTFHEPLMPDADPDEEKAIYNTVLLINRFTEAVIREAPDQWFWMHNRWPKDAWAKAGVMER
ncbi:MAG: lysophospholipid acyltransferase family protein [Hyphomonadaceae bacterium]|nr:lysophospholipid acyltransferase family protein [Hyphomonadaceae bacterium]